MSTSGTSSNGGGSGSNYNYLSFFAAGSYGRKLEGMLSVDPTVIRKKEKRRWILITGCVVSFMFLTNLAVIIGLTVRRTEETGVQVHGNIYENIKEKMEKSLDKTCLPRYRPRKECSQVSAQMVIVARKDDNDAIIYRTKEVTDQYHATPAAFKCEGIVPDGITGSFMIKSNGFYQIYSHAAVKRLSSRETFHHKIIRRHWGAAITVAEEKRIHDCNSQKKTDDGGCFSSSLLATEHLTTDDTITVRFMINDFEENPTKSDRFVTDGHSTSFGIIKLGVVENQTTNLNA